ncbi:PepSY domain-containing protein [Nitrososphaera viennensis]|uniref:PepSY domain-containing protein n=2 Tax=Nitrososphaera viennensis TaxID=1034015 RepID=A0A060HPB7_9ARCH|nr:hypothetical protein [Nitrososphaera viennensis]AIC16970.1 exported protein of unknown function [Nitrososphaera viennensis EN76]UVS68873.1 hypothetical protein NWT39_13310 [Nitrososphaera viennensis]
MGNPYLRKSVVIPAVAVAAVLITALAAGTAFAQEQNKTAPSIKGSVDVKGTVQNYIKDNLKVSFTAAADTAAAQVANGTIVSGNLGVVQGYLAYKFFVVNADTQVGHIVVVDAGNGQVLHTSGDIQMGGGRGIGMFGGHGFKGHGFHGYGSWNHAAPESGPQGTQS